MLPRLIAHDAPANETDTQSSIKFERHVHSQWRYEEDTNHPILAQVLHIPQISRYKDRK